jgi:hypothetical protein
LFHTVTVNVNMKKGRAYSMISKALAGNSTQDSNAVPENRNSRNNHKHTATATGAQDQLSSPPFLGKIV